MTRTTMTTTAWPEPTTTNSTGESHPSVAAAILYGSVFGGMVLIFLYVFGLVYFLKKSRSSSWGPTALSAYFVGTTFLILALFVTFTVLGAVSSPASEDFQFLAIMIACLTGSLLMFPLVLICRVSLVAIADCRSSGGSLPASCYSAWSDLGCCEPGRTSSSSSPRATGVSTTGHSSWDPYHGRRDAPDQVGQLQELRIPSYEEVVRIDKNSGNISPPSYADATK